MQRDLDCLVCLARQALDSARRLSDDEMVHEQVMRKSLQTLAGMDRRLSPPEISRQIQGIVREALREEDPYRELKAQSNALAWRLYPALAARVAAAPDPFEAALRIAIAGNIIDYGVPGAGNDDVEQSIERALKARLDRGVLKALRGAAAEAERILYIGDNAGEIVLDRLLVEQLPKGRVTFAVRGGPTINDATLADAEAARLAEVCTVIDNGADVPGTVLARCSREFRDAFAAADLVISKGQGNYETLSDAGRPVFHLFMVKCEVVARQVGCALGSLQIVRT